ncbi:MAG: hypothetical protein QM775_13835 [Pirellulales bacterium]
MMQDKQEEKTFAPDLWTTLTRGPGRVWLPVVGFAVFVAGFALIVWMLSPEKQHLLFDVALAILAVFGALWLLRYGIGMNAGKPHAEMRSLTYGVACGGAILALLLFTLHGRTVGWTQTPALVIGFACVMIVGALVGALLGTFCYWPAKLVGDIAKLDYRATALVTGALAGLIMAALLMLAPDAGFTLQAAALRLKHALRLPRGVITRTFGGQARPTVR